MHDSKMCWKKEVGGTFREEGVYFSEGGGTFREVGVYYSEGGVLSVKRGSYTHSYRIHEAYSACITYSLEIGHYPFSKVAISRMVFNTMLALETGHLNILYNM